FQSFRASTNTAPTKIYNLSLHDALPICTFLYLRSNCSTCLYVLDSFTFFLATLSPFNRHCYSSTTHKPCCPSVPCPGTTLFPQRSEEHTSELQSRENLVCRLLLEKKKKA